MRITDIMELTDSEQFQVRVAQHRAAQSSYPSDIHKVLIPVATSGHDILSNTNGVSFRIPDTIAFDRDVETGSFEFAYYERNV